ncbi:MAG TPA: hypothetical protein VFM56_12705 [Solimonas sp.]|nr:hypothetical protein [Solimonas sp.]
MKKKPLRLRIKQRFYNWRCKAMYRLGFCALCRKFAPRDVRAAGVCVDCYFDEVGEAK